MTASEKTWPASPCLGSDPDSLQGINRVNSNYYGEDDASDAFSDDPVRHQILIHRLDNHTDLSNSRDRLSCYQQNDNRLVALARR